MCSPDGLNGALTSRVARSGGRVTPNDEVVEFGDKFRDDGRDLGEGDEDFHSAQVSNGSASYDQAIQPVSSEAPRGFFPGGQMQASSGNDFQIGGNESAE